MLGSTIYTHHLGPVFISVIQTGAIPSKVLASHTNASRFPGEPVPSGTGRLLNTVLKLAGTTTVTGTAQSAASYAQAGPPHCPGCGALLCRCVGATRASDPHRGHVTILKAAGTDTIWKCPHCNMQCPRGGGHLCLEKIHQPGSGQTGATRVAAP